VKLRYVKNAVLFADLSEEEQKKISGRMRLVRYREGQTIFEKGDTSEFLYLVKSGWVKIVTAESRVLASMGPGSLLGEADLFMGRPRSTGTLAATNVSLWALSDQDLEKLIAEEPKIGVQLSLTFGSRIDQLNYYLVEKSLKQISAFADLSEEELLAIATRLTVEERRRGDVTYRSEEDAEALYIIESGRVKLIPIVSEEEEVSFVELDAGAIFGEMGLLTGRPYAESAQTMTEATLWTLSREDFWELTGDYPAIRAALSARLRAHLSPKDQALAVGHVKGVPLFADLPRDALQGLSKRLLLRHVPKDELIYAEGTPGSALYIIESGQVRIVSDVENEREVFAHLQAGDFFGEMALLTGKSRSSAARAETNTNLWMLYRSDFDELLVQYPAISLALSRTLSERLAQADQRFVERHLRRMSLLVGLSSKQLEDVSARLRPVKYRSGEVILTEGAPGDVMYLIEWGRVEVLSKTDGRSRMLAVLGEGDFFGEMALLSGNPRSATVRAVTDVDLLALYQPDFDELVLKYPTLAVTLGRVLSQRLNRADEHLAEELAEVAAGARAAPAQAGMRPRPKPSRGVVPTTVTARTVRPRIRRTPPLLPGPALKQGLGNVAAWFALRSVGAKLRLVSVFLLFVWLCGISAPATVISAFPSNSLGEGALAFLQTPTAIPTSTPTFPPTPTAILMPTNTPVPPTPTPQPVAIIPTETPTPVPPTDTPIPTLAPPTDTPIPAPPTDIPTPEPPTSTPTPAYDFVLAEGMPRRLGPCENEGGHHILVNVVDAQGNGLPGIKLEVAWPGGSAELETGHKPEKGPGYVDFPMYHGTYSVRVLGARSQMAEGITVDIDKNETCPSSGNVEANSLYHYSYEVVFQRMY
jgi:CRP-like cAMP-binding protein